MSQRSTPRRLSTRARELARRHAILWIVALLAAGAAIAPRPTPSKDLDRGDGVTAPPLLVPVSAALPSDGYEVRRAYLGRVESDQTTRLGFERADRLVRVSVDEGFRVRAGQELARLETTTLETREAALAATLAEAKATLAELVAGPRAEDIARARAAVTRAQADAALAGATAERTARAFREGAVSDQQHDEARLAREAALAAVTAEEETLRRLEAGTRPERIAAQRARVQAIEARQRELAVEREDSVLRAPFDATVVRRFLDPGAVVAPGEPVVELLQTDHLRLRIGVPRDLADALRTGVAHDVTIAGRPARARLIQVLPSRAERSRTVDTIFDPGTLTPTPRSGDLATLELERLVPTPGCWLPLSALVESRRGLWACWVVDAMDADGSRRVRRRELRVVYTEATRAYVSGALEPGDLVVVDGVHRLAPGQAVRIDDRSLAQPTEESET